MAEEGNFKVSWAQKKRSVVERVCVDVCVCCPLITTELVSLALRKPSGVSTQPQFIMIVSDSFSLCEGNALASAIKELLDMCVLQEHYRMAAKLMNTLQNTTVTCK